MWTHMITRITKLNTSFRFFFFFSFVFFSFFLQASIAKWLLCPKLYCHKIFGVTNQCVYERATTYRWLFVAYHIYGAVILFDFSNNVRSSVLNVVVNRSRRRTSILWVCDGHYWKNSWMKQTILQKTILYKLSLERICIYCSQFWNENRWSYLYPIRSS